MGYNNIFKIIARACVVRAPLRCGNISINESEKAAKIAQSDENTLESYCILVYDRFSYNFKEAFL